MGSNQIFSQRTFCPEDLPPPGKTLLNWMNFFLPELFPEWGFGRKFFSSEQNLPSVGKSFFDDNDHIGSMECSLGEVLAADGAGLTRQLVGGRRLTRRSLMRSKGGGLMRPPPLTRPASFMWVSGLLAPKLVAIDQRLLTRCGGRRTQDASTAVLGARSVSDSSEVWLRNRGARIFGTRK